MRIGIVSDTHGHTHRLLDALRVLAEFEVSTVLHCGDIGSVAIPGLITVVPSHFVLGNVDEYDAREIEAAIVAAGHRLHDSFAEIELDGRRIAMTHGHHELLLEDAIAGGQYDLVCYGHTHRVDERRVGNTLVLNPGALYRAKTHTCATVNLENMAIEILTV